MWSFPHLSLSLSHTSLSLFLSLVVCSVGLARATAVKAGVKQLRKQTAEDLCRPLDIACLLTAAPISSPADERLRGYYEERKYLRAGKL